MRLYISEIRNHTNKLKNNRTSVEDGVIAELLKYLGPKTLQELTEIITKIWETEKLPEDCKCALIHHLDKKKEIQQMSITIEKSYFYSHLQSFLSMPPQKNTITAGTPNWRIPTRSYGF